MALEFRKGCSADIDAIEAAYNEHFDFEIAHPESAFTIFKKGVYPTRRDIEKALSQNGLYVCEEEGELLASALTSRVQPPEYGKVGWQRALTDAEVLVINLLMVRPSKAGGGIGTAFLTYLAEQAQAKGLAALRLDTGSQNKRAVHLYEKNGYKIVATASMKVGGVVPHEGHLFLEKLL